MKRGRGLTTKEYLGREPVTDGELALDDIRARGAQEAGAISDGQKQLIDICLDAGTE